MAKKLPQFPKKVFGQQFMTGVGRFQYVNLDEPDTGHEFSTGKYCVTFLVDKEDTDTLSEMLNNLSSFVEVDDISEIHKHPFNDKEGDLHDGDLPQNEKKQGHAGCLFAKFTSNKKPICMTYNEETGESEPIDNSELQAGDYGVVIVFPAAWKDAKGNIHTTLFLKAVMRTREASPDEVFSDQGGGSGADEKQVKQMFDGLKGKAKQEVEEETITVKKPVKSTKPSKEKMEASVAKKLEGGGKKGRPATDMSALLNN